MPPTTITLGSKPDTYWKLYIAIAEAAADYREAPWYGPWNIVLQATFKDFCVPPYFTITCPQFPVAKDIDTFDPKDNESEDSEEGSGEGYEDDRGNGDDQALHCLPSAMTCLDNE